MPWTVGDVDRHKKGLTPKQKRKWVSVANSVLASCLADGGSQGACEGRAVRIANSQSTREALMLGRSPDIIARNVKQLMDEGYSEEVARNIARRIAGLEISIPKPPENTTDQT